MSDPQSTPSATPDDTAVAATAADGRLKSLIAVSLSVAVVLGGLLAVLQTQASANEANSARETTRTAVRAMSAGVASNTLLGVRDEVQAEHDFLPFRRPLIARSPGLGDAAGIPTDPATTASDLRAAQVLPSRQLLAELGPLRLEAERQLLKQQALATTRITWNTRSTQYTTVLAVLAAALFLIGFGLVVEGSIRRVTYALGLAIAVFVACWGAWVYHLPIPSTPDGAIAAAASGAVLTGDGDFTGAIAAYDRAIAAHEDFATAYTGRARARLLAANPDYPITRAFTDSKGVASAAGVRDAERALELNGNRDLLAQAIVGLVAFYDARYRQAITASDDAIAINAQVPDVWLLKSAAQVGLGDVAGATSSLDTALGLLKGADPSARTRLLAASYLSYLASVEHKRPEHAAEARRLANRVVTTETAFTLGRTLSGTLPASGTVSVSGLRYASGRLSLRISWRGLPSGTALGAVAYERPHPDGAWTQPPDLALFAVIGGTGERVISVPLTRVCAPTAVRADVYLNGAPASSTLGPGVAATC